MTDLFKLYILFLEVKPKSQEKRNNVEEEERKSLANTFLRIFSSEFIYYKFIT